MLLVRHAMPHVQPDIPPHLWELDHDGRHAAHALGATLQPGTYHFAASTEPKAIQTATHMAAALGRAHRIHTHPGFGEVQRPHAWLPDHREHAAAYINGTIHDGWEPHTTVIERFQTAIDEQLHLAGDATPVIATHGMAMTTWLAATQNLTDPVAFWRALAFPDIVTVGE